jgi:hypothetical protein
MKIVQLIECTVTATSSKAHDRMDAVVKTEKGLLAVDESGGIWRFDYLNLSWKTWPDHGL